MNLHRLLLIVLLTPIGFAAALAAFLWWATPVDLRQQAMIAGEVVWISETSYVMLPGRGAVRYDIHDRPYPSGRSATGVSRNADDAVDRRLRHLPSYRMGDSPRISPDATWGLGYSRGDDHATTFRVVSLHDDRIVEWSGTWQEPGGLCWLSDSRRWVALDRQGDRLRMALGSLDRPGAVTWRQSQCLAEDWPVAALGPKTLLMRQSSGGYCQVDVDTGVVSPVRWPFPASEEFLEVAPSPDGKRLAWWTRRSPDNDALAAFVSLLQNKGRVELPSQGWAILWVSDVGGGWAREIGRIALPSKAKHGDLQWTPSGKQVSFRVSIGGESTLERVPIPPAP